MASAENTEVRIISFFIVCVVGFGKKVVLRSIHSYRIGKVIFPESDLARLCPADLWGGKPDPPGLSSYEERNKNRPVQLYLTNGKMYMNYKKLIAVTIALTVCSFAGSNVMAHGGGGGGGGGGHGGGFGGGGGFRGGGFSAGGFHGGFRGGGFRGGRFNNRGFDDGFFFLGGFGDPFFYYPYPYYGYYPYGYYPYGYGYGYGGFSNGGFRGGGFRGGGFRGGGFRGGR
jgi:hypothetical protein